MVKRNEHELWCQMQPSSILGSDTVSAIGQVTHPLHTLCRQIGGDNKNVYLSGLCWVKKD